MADDVISSTTREVKILIMSINARSEWLSRLVVSCQNPMFQCNAIDQDVVGLFLLQYHQACHWIEKADFLRFDSRFPTWIESLDSVKSNVAILTSDVRWSNVVSKLYTNLNRDDHDVKKTWFKTTKTDPSPVFKYSAYHFLSKQMATELKQKNENLIAYKKRIHELEHAHKQELERQYDNNEKRFKNLEIDCRREIERIRKKAAPGDVVRNLNSKIQKYIKRITVDSGGTDPVPSVETFNDIQTIASSVAISTSPNFRLNAYEPIVVTLKRYLDTYPIDVSSSAVSREARSAVADLRMIAYSFASRTSAPTVAPSVTNRQRFHELILQKADVQKKCETGPQDARRTNMERLVKILFVLHHLFAEISNGNADKPCSRSHMYSV